jgi:hypothetical protein
MEKITNRWQTVIFLWLWWRSRWEITMAWNHQKYIFLLLTCIIAAEVNCLSALEIRRKIFQDIHPEVANSLHQLANLKKLGGNYEEVGLVACCIQS